MTRIDRVRHPSQRRNAAVMTMPRVKLSSQVRRFIFLPAALLPVDSACSYPDATIDKLAHKSFLTKAPDLAEMVRRMSVGLSPLVQTLAWASENAKNDWDQAAVYYLRTNESRWRSWVTPEASAMIEDALEASGKTES